MSRTKGSSVFNTLCWAHGPEVVDSIPTPDDPDNTTFLTPEMYMSTFRKEQSKQYVSNKFHRFPRLMKFRFGGPPLSTKNEELMELKPSEEAIVFGYMATLKENK